MDLRLFSTSILVVSFLLSFNAHLQSSEVDEESFFDIQVDNDDNEFFEIQINDDELEEVEGVSFSIDGSIKQGITYGLDSPSQLFTRNKKGIETVSTEVFLISEGKPSENTKIKVSGLARLDWGNLINGQYSIGQSKLDLELKDFFIDAMLDSGLWIRLGSQIITRGQLEAVKITDIINPTDLSAPGQIDIKDMRTQVPALFVSVPMGEAILELAAIFDAGSDNFTSRANSFDPNIMANAQGIFLKNLEPDNKWETVARLNYQLNGADISFVAADFNWNQLSARTLTLNEDIGVMEYAPDRVTMFGFSGNVVRNDYLLKNEVALYDGRSFQKDSALELPWVSRRQLVTALGLEYNGISDTTLLAEVNMANILDYNQILAAEEYESGYLLQIRWSGLNELLNIFGAFNKLNGDNSSVTTVSVEYDLTDNVQLDSRIVLYNANSDKDFLFPFKNHDVIKASIKYSF